MTNTSDIKKRPSWKNIIRLGEELSQQSTPEAICRLAESVIQNWFSCQVTIWLQAQEDTIQPHDNHQSIIEEGNFEKVAYDRQAAKANNTITYDESDDILKIIAPLSINGSRLGTIEIKRNNGNIFQKKDIELLDGLRRQIAIALHASHTSQMMKHQVEHLSQIICVSKTIASNLNLDELLKEITEKILQAIHVNRIFIYTVHQGRKKIFLRTEAGKNKFAFHQEEIQFDLDDLNEPIALVARTANCFSRTIEPDKIFPRVEENGNQQFLHELILPITLDKTVLAVLDMYSDDATAFSEIEKDFLQSLTENIAYAIRNATLYRSEQWRRKVAESVREVTGLLTADVELEQVLDRVLTELEHTLPCDFAAIWLTEDNTIDSNREINPGLSLAAVHTSIILDNEEDGRNMLTPRELLHLFKRSSVESTWLQDSLRSDKPLVRTQSSPFEPLGSVLDFPEDYSSIAAPLRIADRRLGVLSLGHHTAGRYGYESQTISETFASYAAVAIENARLYEAAHDQAWISTVLLQVAEATQALNSLDELLATMARITPMLIGVNACIIFLYEKPLEAFLPVASYRIDQEEQPISIDVIFYVNECPVLKQLIDSKSPTWLNQELIGKPEDNLLSYFFDVHSSAALIPMIVHGDIRGAFLVDFTSSNTNNNGFDQPDRFDEKFTIIQGIAHQTALAVENLHLLKSQQEEAYVSIALLQVAQAVVSLNELEETLETIVRITPILTGVKRAAIFLWNKQNNSFSLSQSYGISRADQNQISRNFPPDHFPLLNVVQSHLSMAYHIYSTETESPLDWEKIPPEDIYLANLNIFPQEDNQLTGVSYDSNDSAFLNIQASLLLAYPLSVKGEFLGVMVTQEISSPGEIISTQSRSRRQEITIGITQQAALAIQNDLLQSEAVERERLERELQLAREIQQTFLPDRLPACEGWELDVLWKPAREVGGDFYDVFVLPGNRLGLVIADVADKGMPAALFMTLVRTLIRATAREELSPSAVLEVVNDLLVSDTEHGLFITVAYAVLSLDTGKVVFANAGHNLPILIRNEPKQIEILETTGMALGVLEGIHISDMSKSLNPSDCLIFYTDGITESFSPEGEMFGENRLREIILDRSSESAHHLLQSIDQAVQEFISGLPSSDDVTLLTVRRT